jgi:uncharacterized protein
MADLYSGGRPPAEVMAWIAEQDKRRDPYAPCPCGSGHKFRFCHGARAAPALTTAAARA